MESLDVEWESDLLYWTDSDHRTVEVATIDGSHHKTLLHTSGSSSRDIAVDPRNGYSIYFLTSITLVAESTK